MSAHLVSDPLKDDPGYLLRRASSAAMADFAKRLLALGLRPSEATVLNVIAANANITQSEIGRFLGIASANMAPLVSRLEGRKLIERERVDGRSHGLKLTTGGRTLTVRIKKAIKEHEAALLLRIPSYQRHGFMAVLRLLCSSGPS